MLKSFLKKSYIYIILAIFYIPLIVGVIYSTSTSGARRGDMPFTYDRTDEGWSDLANNTKILRSILNSGLIGLIVATLVVAIALITTFGLWRQKNKSARPIVVGTSSIPLINPDIITAISLSLAFGAMFGGMTGNDTGYFRLIAGQTTMILPFAITIMYPRSEKFKVSLLEASKDLGYGPVKTWFKTYLRHMIPVALAAFGIALAMSFDDFIIARVVSKEKFTIGKQMYEGKLKPWALALGAVMLAITLSGTTIFAVWISRKERKNRKVKK